MHYIFILEIYYTIYKIIQKKYIYNKNCILVGKVFELTCGKFY